MSLLAALSNLIPTLLLVVFLRRLSTGWSLLGVFAVAWALGQVLLVPLTYLLACWLVGSLSPTLAAVSELLLLMQAAALAVTVLVFRPKPFRALRQAFKSRGARGCIIDAAFLTAAVSFSYFFYVPHVIEEPGAIYRSSAYWDFTAHYPIVQNFVFGDNFPAKDETAGELPLLYHFFSDLQVAIVSALGGSLSGAFLWVSVLSLVSLLVLMREFARALFASEAAGWAAAIFAITSSDVRWLFDLVGAPCKEPFIRPFLSFIAPMKQSMVQCPFGNFNVSMFNMFYFLEERHLLFSSVLVLIAAMLLRAFALQGVARGILVGALFALFSQWNVFILPMLLLLLLPGLLRRSSVLGASAAILTLVGVGVMQATAVKEAVMGSGWFRTEELQAHLNLGFATEDVSKSISLQRFLEYYGFAIGPMLLCAAIGLVLMWRRSKRDFALFVPVLLGTFVLINTVQALPQSVYENHKWVKPWQGFLQIAAAAPVAALLVRGSVLRVILAFTLVVVLSVSGIAEAIPFMQVGKRELLVDYPSPLIDGIREKTRPSDVIATSSPREVLMAGRRVYYLDNTDLAGTIPHLRGLSFRFSRRAELQQQLYRAFDPVGFCEVAAELGVAVVEFSPEQQAKPLFSQLAEQVILRADIPRKNGSFAFVSTGFCGSLLLEGDNTGS